MPKLNENEIGSKLLGAYTEHIKPFFQPETAPKVEIIDPHHENDVHIYLAIKGLGVLEEFSLYWIMSDYPVIETKHGNMTTNDLMINLWDRDKEDGLHFREIYIAILSSMMVNKVNAAVTFDDDTLEYTLYEAIRTLSKDLPGFGEELDEKRW